MSKKKAYNARQRVEILAGILLAEFLFATVYAPALLSLVHKESRIKDAAVTQARFEKYLEQERKRLK